MDYSPLSTPNGPIKGLITPNKSSNGILIDDTPRTPTPFKKALADIEKRSGPIKKFTDTPTRLEDITEIMKKEQDLSCNYETDTSMIITVRFNFFYHQ